MDPALSNPDSLGFLGNLSLGANYARNIVAFFVFLAAVFAFSGLWRKQRQLGRLNQAIKLHDEEALDHEELAAVGCAAGNQRAKRDVWTN